MEIILLERIEKLGKIGDVVNVKNGYGRNYLLPQNKALLASEENKAVFEAKKASIEAEDDKKKQEAEKSAKGLENSFFVIIRQAGEDGRLYGSVSARDVAKAIEDAGNKIDKSQVTLDKPIKYLGVNPIKVSLHPEVVITVMANVARSADEAEEAKKEFLNPTKPKEEKPAPELEAEQVEAADAPDLEEALAQATDEPAEADNVAESEESK